jgi:putative DNA primase/helicase
LKKQSVFLLSEVKIISNYQNIPDLLREKPNWVVWGVVGEPLKAPFQPDSLLRLSTVPAKSGVRETWGGFEQAALCVSKGLARGIGYEFDGGGIYGVDLDHVIENGVITPEAAAIADSLNSYTEVSPSGHGLHIFVTADTANITRHRRQIGFVEIYSSARYFTVTGNVYGAYDRVADHPAELQALHDQHLKVDSVKCRVDSSGIASGDKTNHYTLSTINYALTKDPVLRACWNGERRRGDESASDQALMNKLAYWLSADQQAMIAAFLSSPYFAGKDEAYQKKCRRADYLPNTAKTACASLRSTAREDTVRYIRQKSRNDAR